MTNNAKISLFINMAPTATMDYIYGVLEHKMDYSVLKDKVMSWIANKVTTSSGPAPMDMGLVDQEIKLGNTYFLIILMAVTMVPTSSGTIGQCKQ